MVYPEGTLTRDPDLWPMTGKTGAARIALETGCPVIPVGQWGAHEVLPPYAPRPDLLPRKNVTMKAGDPVDARRPASSSRALRSCSPSATDRIMDAVTAIVEELRGEQRARRALRPAQGGRAPDRQPEDEEEAAVIGGSSGKVAVFGAGSWGTAFSIVLADAGNDVTLWARREERRDGDQRAPREPRLPARHRAAARVSATHDVEQALSGADMVVLARRRRRCAQNLTEWAPYVEPDAVLVSLMKGVELGTLERMSEVIAEVDRRRARADRRGQRPQPVARDRPSRAGRLRGRVRRRGRRRQLQERCHSPGVPALHQHRRARLRARRRLQERRRPRRRAWPSGSASATTPPPR